MGRGREGGGGEGGTRAGEGVKRSGRGRELKGVTFVKLILGIVVVVGGGHDVAVVKVIVVLLAVRILLHFHQLLCSIPQLIQNRQKRR